MGVAVAVGTSFTTGNSTVAKLPVGSILEVTGDGQLEVLDVPEDEVALEAGDVINTKYGTATVVRVSSQVSVTHQRGDDAVFYVADEDPVFRVAKREDVSPA